MEPNTHKEQHLVGKSITVVYEIADPTLWRKTSPLHYEHDGVKAYCVSLGDVVARRDKLLTALERIADEGDYISRSIARDAINADGYE